jgi:hypothetical protein
LIARLQAVCKKSFALCPDGAGAWPRQTALGGNIAMDDEARFVAEFVTRDDAEKMLAEFKARAMRIVESLEDYAPAVAEAAQTAGPDGVRRELAKALFNIEGEIVKLMAETSPESAMRAAKDGCGQA